MNPRPRLLLLLGGLLAALPVFSSTAEMLPLQPLLDNLRETPAVAASLYEQQRIKAELQQQQATTGWSLFGGVDTGRYRDTEELNRDEYDGYGAHIGLRHPLLGALQSRRLAVADAELALEQARYSTDLTRAEQRLQLRQTYIDWWRAQELHQWCSRQQQVAESELQTAAARTVEQRLRASEQLWLAQRWRTLLRPCRDLSQLESTLRQQVELLSGNSVPATSKAQTEALPTRLASLELWLPALEQHPSLQVHHFATQHLESLTEQRWSDHIDASFSIAQRYHQRSGIEGNDGGVYAAITFETPLSSLFGAARNNPSRARHLAAQSRVSDARSVLTQLLEQTLFQYHQRIANLEERALQHEYARQLLAEQTARLSVDTEAGFMNLRIAHAEQAAIELGWIEEWHAAWGLLAQLHTLAEDAQPDYSLPALHWPIIAKQHPTPTNKRTAAPSTPSEPSEPPKTWSTAVYIWNSNALLDPEHLDTEIAQLLAAGFNRIYLGFSATQVADLELLSPQITQLIKQLKHRGFTVDLLLGDPHWLIPAHRHQLLQLIERFAHLPFDHLHLDLEVEQLGWPVPAERLQDWLQTLEASVRRSPWPVTITSHHRWLAATERSAAVCIPCALPHIGISEVTVMLYSTVETSIIERSQSMLETWPALRLTLAQSVESNLSKGNSWYGSDAEELHTLTLRLSDSLKHHQLVGIAWQDWNHYRTSITAEKTTP